MAWRSSPFVWPLLASALLAAALAAIAWRRRSAPGALPLFALMIAVSGWCGMYAVQNVGANFKTQLVASWISYLFNVWVPLFFLAFVLDHTGRQRWLNRRFWLLGAIMPLLTIVFVLTSPWLGLYHASLGWNVGRQVVEQPHGPWYWVYVVYSYGQIALAVGLLLQSLRRSPSLYRGQAAATLIGAMAPWLLSVLPLVGINLVDGLDLTPLGFTISGIALGYGLLRYRMLDIVPVARDALIQGMEEGLLVLDSRNRIIDLNTAAQQVLGLPASAVIGQPAAVALARWSEFIDRYGGIVEGQTQIEVEIGSQRRYLDLRISPLRDRQGRINGRLIVWRDISERIRAELQLQEAKQAIERQNQRFRDGLALARDIQIALLPTNIPWDTADLAIHASSLPALEVGGDFYTFTGSYAHGRVGVAIGDISGKGIAAALMMALTSSLVEDQTRAPLDPGECLRVLNRRLGPRLRSTRMNAALLYLTIDLAQAALSFANAGMIGPLLLRDGVVRLFEEGGFPLGMVEEAVYGSRRVAIAEGDLIALVSDGIVEAMNPQGELFGFERLEGLLAAAARPHDPAWISAEVLAQVGAFADGAEQHDDMTVIILHVVRLQRGLPGEKAAADDPPAEGRAEDRGAEIGREMGAGDDEKRPLALRRD